LFLQLGPTFEKLEKLEKPFVFFFFCYFFLRGYINVYYLFPYFSSFKREAVVYVYICFLIYLDWIGIGDIDFDFFIFLITIYIDCNERYYECRVVFVSFVFFVFVFVRFCF